MKKAKNQLFEFFKKNNKGFIASGIFFLLSLITLYFSIDNSFIFFVSIPLSLMSFFGVYVNVISYKNYVQQSAKKEETEREKKLIDDETELFKSLSNEKKNKYLNEHPNSLISKYVKNYIKNDKKIKLLKKLIRIENQLQKKFDDKFYKEINPLNFNEKLDFILTTIKEQGDIKIYCKEKVLEDKIKFFTFFQIFNDDLYNIDLQPLKNGVDYGKHIISFNDRISINENFIHKLNEILKNTENPFMGQYRRRNMSGGPIYLNTLIENHLINNYDKIVGNIKKIEKLNKLYIKYKGLESRFIPFNELGISKRLGNWNYLFYEEKNRPDVSMIPNDNQNYSVGGKKVLNQINLILEK